MKPFKKSRSLDSQADLGVFGIHKTQAEVVGTPLPYPKAQNTDTLICHVGEPSLKSFSGAET